jgi:uncharacterized protein (TIGR02300 family)
LTGAFHPTNRSADQQNREGNTVAKPDLGTKRQCLSCGTKFYDLAKDPIVCPRCGATFQPAMLARRAEPVKQVEEEDEIELEAVGPEIISLEDADAEETVKDDVIEGVEDDVDVDVDVDDDFLAEEEEGDDDVADLIDGEIEDDEEA